jgi:DNA-binding CsgD family transcriptional regulator
MLENLSSREREIFDLLLEGISPKEIANRLNVSYSTVDFHRTRLYGKLGVHSIQELFAKYSSNSKVPPAEPEDEIPISGTKMQKRFKLLRSVRMAIGLLMLAFSVLLILIFLRKSFANKALKGVIIPVTNMGFYAASDAENGGNSTSEVYVSHEEIDGVTVDNVLNIKTNLVKTGNSTVLYAQAQTNRNDVIQQLRKANGIRFKARGDGKSWAVEFKTIESNQERNWACYSYFVGTVRDQVIIIDVPYSGLFLPEWWRQYSFDFNKERIIALAITAHNATQGEGSSSLQIFDFEIY